MTSSRHRSRVSNTNTRYHYYSNTNTRYHYYSNTNAAYHYYSNTNAKYNFITNNCVARGAIFLTLMTSVPEGLPVEY